MPRQFAAILGTCLIFASVACKTERPQTRPSPPAPESPGKPLAAAPTPARQDDKVATFTADPHQHMKAHFVHTIKMQDAVLAANLTEARAQGRWLATHDDGDAPDNWRPFLKTFQSESSVVANARPSTPLPPRCRTSPPPAGTAMPRITSSPRLAARRSSGVFPT